MKLPTVKICNEKEDDFIIINESDYDPKKHKLYDEVQKCKQPEPKKKKPCKRKAKNNEDI